MRPIQLSVCDKTRLPVQAKAQEAETLSKGILCTRAQRCKQEHLKLHQAQMAVLQTDTACKPQSPAFPSGLTKQATDDLYLAGRCMQAHHSPGPAMSRLPGPPLQSGTTAALRRTGRPSTQRANSWLSSPTSSPTSHDCNWLNRWQQRSCRPHQAGNSHSATTASSSNRLHGNRWAT